MRSRTKPARRVRIQLTMRFVLMAVLAAGLAAGAGPDARAIVSRAIEVEQSNYELLARYGFRERVKKIDFDKHGQPVKVDVKTFRVMIIEGGPYWRLVSRNGSPLSPAEEESERIKLEQAIAARRRETEKQRRERLRKSSKTRRQNREAIEEIPRAFLFELTGEETVRSRPAWVIAFTPRPGYRPKHFRARLFTKMSGRLWVDQETGHWVRVSAGLTGTVSFGWFLLRIYPLSKVEAEARLLDSGIWAIDRLWYIAALRAGLVKYMHWEQEHRYSDYRPPPAGPTERGKN